MSKSKRRKPAKTSGAGPQIVCSRCGRSTPLMKATGWNSTVRRGVIVANICDRCQTPEENAEAEINEATTEYTSAFGLFFGRPKGSGG